MLRYWTGWQQVHERLAKQTEGPPTVLLAGGSGVPHGRRTVICRCGKYQVDAPSDFRSSCGQPLDAFREQWREQKRRVRVGYHHGSRMCMDYRGYRCDCLLGLGLGGTPVFDLNDCDDSAWCAREKTCHRGCS